jgi:alginate O-acetyltransferase complex protein AlgI
VVTGWVLFRNENLDYASSVIRQMYSFDFFDGKFAMNNDFLFMSLLAFIISFFALIPKTQRIQDRLYGEQFASSGKWAVVAGGLCLYYVSLSYVSALDFNPFIYFRF